MGAMAGLFEWVGDALFGEEPTAAATAGAAAPKSPDQVSFPVSVGVLCWV